ncbi:hypothetical protein DICPUDRAFT_100174 [Dictyostelium purpureum]|uniref:Uncharacterized protein n=1 Tax=Dictyostelium purpureum TaxID=5786 RepID=F1A687_DICPU|nr:uncharacterized protein DICPUDRAFT_100174 [Dictyostelium purpureum]EGC28292.1 hypothetical protein DICPUDRAFT_100174 [Dictyostelium purpureum]|eukprot:XP_003295181.1 hypothetical protein DICPUDRAFT_100174 [Dictyostelium purpureum]
MYNNNSKIISPKFYLVLLFLISLINYGICKEFRLTTFLNPYCEGIPSITLSSTTCSPDNYFQVLNNTMISNTNIDSNRQHCNDQYSNSHTNDFFPINQCVTVDEEDHNSYSIIMTTNEDTNPRSIDGYCNQFNFFDCNNYNIVSFKNNSCFIYDDYHIKQTCDQDFIYTYKCNDNCFDTNCHLDKREPNNVDNDCLKKSIKINEIQPNNNTINNTLKNNTNNNNNNKNNNNYNNNTVDNNVNKNNNKDKISNNNNNGNNNNSHEVEKDKEGNSPINTQTFERFNTSSKLFSNFIFVLISITITITIII